MKLHSVAVLPYNGENNERTRKNQELGQKIASFLQNNGIETICSIQDVLRHKKKLDLIIVLGGDGIFIQTAAKLIDLKTPFLGINFGTKGYLLPIKPEDSLNFIQNLLEGYIPEIEKRIVLNAKIYKNNLKILEYVCINELVIKSDFYLAKFTVEVDGRKVLSPSADGIIIATPTGSTAYNFSAGGIVLPHDSDKFAITAIACGDRRESNYIVNASKKIRINVEGCKVLAIHDGIVPEDKIWLEKGDYAIVTKYKRYLYTVAPKEHDTFSYLREKLY